METKQFSPNTIEAYCSGLKTFLSRFKDFDHPKNISADMIKDYVHQIGQKSVTLEKLAICALRLFYTVVIHQIAKLKGIPYPVIHQRLPSIIDKSILLYKISRVHDRKDKAILATLFSTGVRVSECCTLRIADINSVRMEITVRRGKGDIDRIVPLSKTLLRLLREYISSLPAEMKACRVPIRKRTTSVSFDEYDSTDL